MSKNRRKQADGELMFTFGEPEPVHNERILDYLGVFPDFGGEYYIPPISLSGLAKMRRANGQHGSCVLFRRNMAANAYVAGAFSVRDFRAACSDLLSTGNAFAVYVKNRLNGINGLAHIPAINMRVKTDGKGFRQLLPGGQYIDFTYDEMVHIREYDEIQQIYGVPDWLGGLQSALLNQDATLFRRRYFVNGAHLGYILYSNDAKMGPETKKALEEKFRQGKGVGNFKSSFIHIPNGGEKALQIVSIGDISQKDEFLNIKNISANDVLTAHRVPPVLMGLMPTGNGSLGDPEKVERVYVRTEVRALCQNFMDINDRLPARLQLKFNFKVENDEKD